MWNLKHNTKKYIYETQTHKQRTDLSLPRGRRAEDGRVGDWGLADAN